MPQLIVEPLTGIIDGVNTTFSTSGTYTPGTIKVFLNGQLKRKEFDDGFIELGGTQIQMKIPPEPMDDLQARYISLV